MPLHSRCARRRGFTLVEMLVVIAGVMTMASLLVPVLGRAKTQAQVAGCLSNQRQLAVGWGCYANDSLGVFPQNYMEGTYWAKKPGLPYFYSGFQAWMVVDDWPNYLGNGGVDSYYSGIGHAQPYVPDGRVFYCPGTSKSRDWYRDRWQGEDASGRWGFGVEGRGTTITYMYRSGMYYPDAAPPTAVIADISDTRDRLKRIDEAQVHNRTMLTCFWEGYAGSATNPNLATIPHAGEKVNLLATDGHAKPWKLPPNILPIWGRFDAGAYSLAGFNTHDFYAQMPWWWVEADRVVR